MAYFDTKEERYYKKLEDGNYIFVNHYETKLDEEQFLKNKQVMLNTKETAEKQLKRYQDGTDYEEAVKKEDEKLAKIKERLADFDNIYDKEVEDMIKNKETERQELQKQVRNFNKTKNENLKKIAAATVKNIEHYHWEVEQHNKTLELFENV